MRSRCPELRNRAVCVRPADAAVQFVRREAVRARAGSVCQ
jgi:hypothetical protein